MNNANYVTKKPYFKSPQYNRSNRSKLSLPHISAVILYDLLIIIAVLLLATSLLFFSSLLFGFNTPNPHSIFFRLYLASIIVSYYHICWAYVPNGQTLGMMAWGVKLLNNKSNKITILQSMLRIIGGIIGFIFFGLGYLRKQSLADYLSGTKLIK